MLGSPHPLSNIIKADDNELFVESDCDEQLIITIRFQSTVKVNSLRIYAPDTGNFFFSNFSCSSDPNQAPYSICFYRFITNF